MSEIQKTYKYRLYPTEEQQQKLDQQFAAIRWIYNAALEQRVTYGRRKGTDAFYRESSFNYVRQDKELSWQDLKQDADLAWISDCLLKDTATYALQDLDKAYTNFFKTGAGYPKPWRFLDNNSYKAKIYVGKHLNLVFGKDTVKLPKVGRVKYTKHKKFGSLVTTATVIREGSEYYICVTSKIPLKEANHQGACVGIDLGVTVPMATSDGLALPKNAALDALEKRYRKFQKRFARKTNKQSNRRKRIKAELAGIKRHQTRVRKSNIHKATTELAKTYSYIAIEDLKVKNMTASAKGSAEEHGKNVKAKAGLNREILNVSPYMMREKLAYKTVWYGSHLETVDPKYTSQTCSSCGHVSRENRTTQARFECQECGYKDNADVNAAKNILSKSGISETAQGLRKTPSENHQVSATSKSIVSVFTPLTHYKSRYSSNGYGEIRSGVP